MPPEQSLRTPAVYFLVEVLFNQRKSQARFITAKLKPTVTHSLDDALGGAPVPSGDDVSLKVFILQRPEHLMKLAIAS